MPKVVSMRRRSSRRSSLTAASQPVRNARAFKRSFGTASSPHGEWQDQAWRYVRAVGELDYYVRWRSNSVSRCRLMASTVDDRGQPTGGLSESESGTVSAEAARVQEIVTGIGGSGPGQAKLLRRTAYVLSVPGEVWVAMLVRDPTREEDASTSTPDSRPERFNQPEQWFAFDRSEITAGVQDVILKLPDGMKHTFDPAVDVMFRIWEEDPQQASQPTSPVRTNVDPLNEIVRASASIDAHSKSRLTGNGIFLLPQEISIPSQLAPSPTLPNGQSPIPPPPPMAGLHATAQDFQDLLIDVATEAINNPDSVAAGLPIVATAPGDQIKNALWLRSSSDVPATALATREAAIRRLAMGLDVSPERLLGLGSTSNHWSLWGTDEIDVKVHIAPLLEMICDALTQQVLRPKLISEGIDPEKYVVWYDTTDLTQDPDKKEEAQEAFDRGAISSAALREYLGLDTDAGYDLEKPEGWLAMIMDRVAQDPANLPIFMPMLRQLAKGKLAEALPEEEPPAIEPAPSQPADEDEPAADGEPATQPAGGEPPGVTATAGLTVARLCVNRALELAAKRQRNRTNAHLFRNVDIQRAYTALGPVAAEDVEGLIEGWSNGVCDSDLEAIGIQPGQFRAIVYGVASLALITASEPVLTSSMLKTSPST